MPSGHPTAESRYQLLFEHAPVCIHELDEQGRLVSMNDAGLRMLNCRDEQEVVGQDYLDAVS